MTLRQQRVRSGDEFEVFDNNELGERLNGGLLRCVSRRDGRIDWLWQVGKWSQEWLVGREEVGWVG